MIIFSSKPASTGKKAYTNQSPACRIFFDRACSHREQLLQSALRHDIQAVVLQQSKDNTNQFSGS